MPVPPPNAEMLARMPMAREEYEKLRPRSRLTLVKQKLINMIARNMLHPGLRIWLYRQMGINIGQHCVVEMFSYMDDQFPELIFFDDYSGPSRYVVIVCHDDVNARTDPDSITHHGYVAPVRMESYTALGAGSIVLPGVTIHKGAAVGAGAVVTRDIPPYTLAVGVPAKVIKYLKTDQSEANESSSREIKP
jgi:acetyltransferase-like isoleucine patch superfamily enzyme